MRKINNKKGFTMVELLIVVALLGIFATVSIPLFGSLIQSQNASTCNVCQMSVYESYLNWDIETGNWKKSDWEEKYPDEVSRKDDSNPFLTETTSYNSKTDTLEGAFRQSFIDELSNGIDFVPTCPKSGNYYVISWNGDLVIECYDNTDNLENGHNNSTSF